VQNSYGCVDSAKINITFSFSACTGINDMSGRQDWKLYPNPPNGVLNLEIANPDRYFTVQLTDKLGRVMNEQGFSAIPGITFHGMIHIDDLPAGLYFVRLTGDSVWSVRKIIIR
jgi:hypothetical protein